jgi:hypothetical protein
MKIPWRRSAISLIVVSLLLNLSVVTVLYHFTVSPDSTPGNDTGPIGDEWHDDTVLPSQLVIPIPEELNPSRPDLTFEEAKASWDNFTEMVYHPDLDIDPTQAKYYSNISEVLNPSPVEWSYISENGFVVVDIEGYWSKNTFEDLYYYYWENDLPVFITTDTILNTFHLLFDQFLQEAENRTLRPLLSEMTSELLEKSVELHDETGHSSLRESLKEIVVFFGVASRLLETGDDIPAYAISEVNDYAKKIIDAEVVEQYPGQDYTQYKPRGHYAGRPFLEKYFRAMMWYGRRSLDMKKDADVLESCLVSLIVLSSEQAQVNWGKIYDITAYLVGKSDSLNFFDILKAMYVSLGDWDINLLANPSNIDKVKEELKKDEYYRQRILSDVVYKPGDTEPIEFPKIFQFMGQRYVPDSEIMQNVMYDRVPLAEGGRRGLPSSLDVMAAMGSSRALANLKAELEKYEYEEQLMDAWASVETRSEEYWEQSAYFGLLRSYKELISGEEGDEYPDFMRTEAWADEKLNSALGSWAELRHDTILYAKQPYSPGIICGTPDALVEPYPTFYARIEKLSIMMRDIIVNNFDLDDEYAMRYVEVFEEFAQINFNLTSISEHELEGKPLTPEESAFVRGIFIRKARGICGPPIPDGWLPSLIEKAGIEDRTKDTRIVADVATDSGSPLTGDPPRVLHVATGYVRSAIVVYEMPNGQHSFFVGPVYSFYEFPLGGFSRLNDDEWKELLDSDDCPPDPFWTSSFMA